MGLDRIIYNRAPAQQSRNTVFTGFKRVFPGSNDHNNTSCKHQSGIDNKETRKIGFEPIINLILINEWVDLFYRIPKLYILMKRYKEKRCIPFPVKK